MPEIKHINFKTCLYPLEVTFVLENL